MGAHLSKGVSRGTRVHLQGRANELILEKWAGRPNASVETFYLQRFDTGRILVEIRGYDGSDEIIVEPNYALHVAR